MITEDIRPAWLNVIRRLQSVCHRNQGVMAIGITVVIDEHGDPVLWTEPRCTRFEPRRAKDEIIALLTGE